MNVSVAPPGFAPTNSRSGKPRFHSPTLLAIGLRCNISVGRHSRLLLLPSCAAGWPHSRVGLLSVSKALDMFAEWGYKPLFFGHRLDFHTSGLGFGRAVSSAVEHYVDIVGVTGSIPVSPTIPSSVFAELFHRHWWLAMAAGRSGGRRVFQAPVLPFMAFAKSFLIETIQFA